MRSAGYGATGTFEFADPRLLGPSYAISSHMEYEPRPDWLAGNASFGMPRAFVSTPFPGDFLMGPLSLRGLSEDEPTACYSGRIIEEMSFAPPPGRRFVGLPEDIRVATANLEFTARWSSMMVSWSASCPRSMCSARSRRWPSSSREFRWRPARPARRSSAASSPTRTRRRSPAAARSMSPA